jgi:hypothetical protein
VRSPFKSTPDGVKVALGSPELELLESLPEFLADVREGGPADPAFARLNPAAYRDDFAAQHDYATVAAPMLAEARAGHETLYTEGVEAVADGRPLTLEQAEAWLTVIGDARLALAARLGITDPAWSSEPAAGPAREALDFLGYLQDRLVATLTKTL